MKIKTRITLFVVLSGLVASLLLSVWLICELLAQPFRFLDKSLYDESAQAVRMFSIAADIELESTTWMEIHDVSGGEILYRSPLAEVVDLSAANSEVKDFEKPITALTTLASVFRYFSRAPGDPMYRTRSFEISYGDRSFQVQVARPMDKLDRLEKGLWKAIGAVAASLVFVTLVLIVIGRVVAGKILRPIRAIMLLAQNISDKNLIERIPVGHERDELAELSETLNRMLDRLQFSFTRQKELLFDTSHELKTPLTTIRMAVEEMSACNGLIVREEARDNLFRMEVQVFRMERLVKDLLSLSALEAMLNVAQKPVRVDVLLSSLIDEYRFWTEAEDIRVETEIQEGLVLLGDEEKLRRAFSNALDNAIKYNEEQDGERSIAVHAFGSAEALTVVVSNTGGALSEEESRRIFDQFHRVDKSKSPQMGGSGLGLAIVKKTVELHQGEVLFESVTTGSRNMNRLIFSFPGVSAK